MLRNTNSTTKLHLLLALIATLVTGCLGNHPVGCSCLEVRVTGGANNTPITDAQLWLIDPVNGDRQLAATRVVNTVAVSDEACSTDEHVFEVRKLGYVSQRFTHRSSIQRLGCDPAPPPEPVVNVQLVPQ